MKEQQLTEYNIENFILERKNKTYLEIFEELEDIVFKIKEQNPYCSIIDNYIPIFMYWMMEQKVTRKEFSNFLKNTNYEKGLYRFFNGNDSTKDSLWYEISSFFYKNNNTKIDENKICYIQEILKNVGSDEKRIYDFHCSSIHYFLTELVIQNIQCEEIIDIIFQNKNLLKDKKNKYINVLKNIILDLGDLSYETKTKEIFDFVQKNKIMKKELEKSLLTIKEERNEKEIKCHLNILNFYKNNLPIEDIVKILKEQIAILFQEKDILGKDLSTELFVSLEKIDYIVDVQEIDIKKSLRENYIPIVLLDILIRKNRLQNIENMNEKIFNYLQKNLDLNTFFNKQDEKQKYLALPMNFWSLENFDKLKKIVLHNELNQNLENIKKSKTLKI